MSRRIYESVLDDWTPDKNKSQSQELRKTSQNDTYIPGEGAPYDKFLTRIRIQLTIVPGISEYNYNLVGVIENVKNVLDSARFIDAYSEIFLTSNDEEWLSVSELISKDNYQKTGQVFFTNDTKKYMGDGLYLNFSFNYNENAMRSPLAIAKLLIRLNDIIYLSERDFESRCRYVGIWWKYSGFWLNRNIISIHEMGLVQFIRSNGQIDPVQDRNYSGYCQINKLYHLFFDADTQVYDYIFDKCHFDIHTALINTVHQAIYGLPDPIETLIPYQAKQKILIEPCDFSRFLKSIRPTHQINKNFFFFMYPIPDQNIQRRQLKQYYMPVYDTSEFTVDSDLKSNRDLIVNYLKNNKVYITDVRVIEDNRKFSVVLLLDTLCPEDEVPIDVCACFRVNPLDDEIPEGKRLLKSQQRKEIYEIWLNYTCKEYLSKIMSEDAVNVIKSELQDCIKYL